MNHDLATLLKRADIWQSSASQRPRHTIATGYSPLDKALHQGGWPTQALTEILFDHPGSGELQLLLPAIQKLCAQGRRLVFINPPHLPYAPALQLAGIPPGQVLVIYPQTPADQLWATEQTLRANIAAALLVWPKQSPQLAQLRKLQLAAQANQGLSLLLRPATAVGESSPAALRLQLGPTANGCQITVIKQRGGWAGQIVELNLAEALTEPAIAPAELPVHQPLDIPAQALPTIEIPVDDNQQFCRSDLSRDRRLLPTSAVAAKAAPTSPTTPGTAPSWLH